MIQTFLIDPTMILLSTCVSMGQQGRNVQCCLQVYYHVTYEDIDLALFSGHYKSIAMFGWNMEHLNSSWNIDHRLRQKHVHVCFNDLATFFSNKTTASNNNPRFLESHTVKLGYFSQIVSMCSSNHSQIQTR